MFSLFFFFSLIATTIIVQRFIDATKNICLETLITIKRMFVELLCVNVRRFRSNINDFRTMVNEIF